MSQTLAASRKKHVDPGPIPERIGRYRLERLIGVGGMGSVFEAEDPDLGRRVAVKRLSDELARDPAQRERFVREARAAARVSCPGVVTIYEIAEDQGVPFIVMEYVEGLSLSDALAHRGRIPVNEAVEIVRQVALALEAAHAVGVLHRDIKPDNVLLSPGGRARVTDFGIAKILGATVLTRVGDVMGTTAYMAPEQALGEAVDGRSDLYSLGCVAYELLCGAPPFEAETPFGIIYRHVSEKPVAPSRIRPDIPPALERIVLTLLAKSPGDRYASAGDVVRSLDALGAGDRAGPGEPPSPSGAEEAEEVAERREIRFVGRDRELDRLKSLLQRAIAGRGGVCLIAGEAGVGKTRLVTELEGFARRRGVRFLQGTCLYREGTIPYLPFVAAIRCYFRLARRDSSNEEREAIKEFLRKDAPELRAVVPQVGTFIGRPDGEEVRTPLEDHGRAQERLFQCISDLIEKVSEHRPLVLFLDDLQWADAASLKLLHYIASGCQDDPILLLGAYRTEELRDADPGGGAALLDTIQRLGREGRAETLNLSRFTEGEVADLVGQCLPGRCVDGELVGRLYTETSGNPLFVLELVELFRQEGTLGEEDGIWRWTGESGGAVPARVRDVLVRRVDRLPPDDRALLECAAVVGDPFDAGMVGRVLERKKMEVLRQLQRLETQARMIRCEADGFHFDHPKLQEVIYEDIPDPMRRELHRLVAGEVREAEMPTERKTFALAKHYDRAGDAARAFPALISAAGQALRLFAYEERSYYLGRALRIVPPSDLSAAESAGLYLDLGETEIVLGRWAQAEDACARALDLGRRAARPEIEARALADLGLARFKQSGWDEAQGHFEESLSVYRSLGDPRGIGECEIGMGNIAFESGRWGDAESHYRSALEVGNGGGVPEITARAGNNLGALSNACGRCQDAIGWYERALASLEIYGDDLGMARAFHNLGMSYLDLEQWEKAEAYLDRSLTISTRIRQPDLMSITSLLIADLRFRRGRLAEATSDCLRALAAFKRRADRPGEADAYRILGAIHTAEGAWAEADQVLRKSLEINLACGQRLQSAETERELGRLEERRGNPVEARRHFAQARSRFQEVGADGAARELDLDLDRLAVHEGSG